jgi:spore germination cell wall hydrolase CwlJ-like protein
MKQLWWFFVAVTFVGMLMTAVTAAHAEEGGGTLFWMLAGEAAFEPLVGQAAVAGVALDRVEDSRFPNTLLGVLTQSGAFYGLRRPMVIYPLRIQNQIREAIRLARAGWRPCGHVLWFDNVEAFGMPSWAAGKRACTIGQHTFFDSDVRPFLWGGGRWTP